MDSRIYTKELLGVLRRHKRAQRALDKRPLFVFCCGGDRATHRSRSELVRYVESSKRDELRNVFFIVAENIADSDVFGNLDLLTQEAVIADVSDSLILFAESVGSFCELGAFASLPHIRSILTVAVDRRHSSSKSFLVEGPVRVVAEADYPLNRVFPVDLNCPMKSPEFSSFVNNIRSSVKESDQKGFNRSRKKLNGDSGIVFVGSLVHELLDLVFLFGPIEEDDLIGLYCGVQGIQRSKVRIRSLTLFLDMKKGHHGSLTFHQILGFMESVDIVRTIKDGGMTCYYTDYQLEDYFMFKGVDDSDFVRAISKAALSKRRRGREGYANVYRRNDI